MNRKFILFAMILLSTIFLTNCGSDSAHKPTHDHKHDEHKHHEHIAPNGGVLVELGDEFAHLEFVVDRTNNKIICYIFDGSLQFGLKAKQATIEAEIKGSENTKIIVFNAVSNVLANNTLEESSQFEANLTIDPNTKISFLIKKIILNGKSFENIVTPIIGQK